MIIDIVKSPVQFKRYRVTLDNGKSFDFGYKGGDTYIDHLDKIKRHNYLVRHMANATEKQLIENLVPSPSLFSAQLLWSYLDDNSTSLKNNIKILNAAWKKKHLKSKK